MSITSDEKINITALAAGAAILLRVDASTFLGRATFHEKWKSRKVQPPRKVKKSKIGTHIVREKVEKSKNGGKK